MIRGHFFSPDERKNLPTPFKAVDNNIIMPDLRAKSNGEYRLRDRFLGFDLNHYYLVIEAQAKLHALSWAYKCKTGIQNLTEKFPFLKPKFEMMIRMMQPLIDANFLVSKQILVDHPEEVKAIEYLQSIQKSSGGLYWNFEYGQTELGHTKDNVLKKPLPSVENEEPWNVVLHGDAWSNNMMFRYDEQTDRPVEVLFVDFQMSNEGDPVSDICYTLYASVAPEVRKKHLNSFLRVYYDTFTRICDQLSIPYLPGWSWEEFNRRFHRAKVIGAMMSCILLPIILKSPDELTNLDSAADAEEQKGKSTDAMEAGATFFAGLSKSNKENPILKNRLLAIFREMVEDGIL
ncbi:unnamed protein product [Allacma fusca]|uniref:CHK kinase-like domain-containing protein n=1 Tax=Allacma fusca TaxID=39272 RepID=A0A8J2JGI6_9HEXA|nr:unnamed protein product [Allacma fusca]